MAWTTDLVMMLRVLVSDVATPQTYTDSYLSQVLVTAGVIVDAEITFAYTYSYDIGNITISPDPVVSEDAIFMALVPLKAACIINQGEFKQALGQGIKVRDGDSAIDTSVSFRGYKDIIELGPCAAYEKLKWSLIASGSSAASLAGRAVFGPYRTANGSQPSALSWYDQFSTESNGRRDRS